MAKEIYRIYSICATIIHRICLKANPNSSETQILHFLLFHIEGIVQYIQYCFAFFQDFPSSPVILS